jgi:TPR repeat protein
LGFAFNNETSLHYLQLASSRGVPDADLQLSTRFGYGGAGVSPNPYLAHLHAQLAAEGGLAEGFYQLGTFYEFGMGVAKDQKVAHNQRHTDAIGRIDQFLNRPTV